MLTLRAVWILRLVMLLVALTTVMTAELLAGSLAYAYWYFSGHACVNSSCTGQEPPIPSTIEVFSPEYDITSDGSQAVIWGKVILSESPYITFKANTTTTGTLSEATAIGEMYVVYQKQLDQVAVPPSPTPLVPYLFSAVASGEMSGSGQTVDSQGNQTGWWSSDYGGGFALGIGIWVSQQWNIPPGMGTLEVNNLFWAPPGLPATIQLWTGCDAQSGETSGADCSAYADPTLTLDQGAFDAYMGANTYPLANYFSFESSPNLTAEVPEPSSLFLAALGFACLAWAAGFIEPSG